MTKELAKATQTALIRNDETLVSVTKDATQPQSNTWMTNSYIHAATSDNTRSAYQTDIRHFEDWGGKLPTNTEIIIAYLQHFATRLNPRTLSRRLTALKNWHRYQDFPDPTLHPVVNKTLAGIMRTHGKPKVKAPPLLPEQLLLIIDYLSQQQTLVASRDSAILQLGFLGAFRRSELVAIQVEHVQWLDDGLEILIPHSKTDQLNEGQYSALPYGNQHLCPVKALKQWLELANITEGVVFRNIDRWSHIGKGPLDPKSINTLLKQHAKAVDIQNADKLSSHSLRRGLATSASRDGVSLPAIMRQGRWRDVNTVLEYIEATERFTENAAKHIIKKLDED